MGYCCFCGGGLFDFFVVDDELNEKVYYDVRVYGDVIIIDVGILGMVKVGEDFWRIGGC